jgi:Mce-associated membrane protein
VIDMKARHDSTSGRCDEDHANDPAAPPADGAPHSLLRWLTAAALVVSLTGATGDLGWLRFQRYQADIAAAQAFDAAQKYAFKLANFDANAIDQHFADIHDGSTGEFQGRHAKHSERLRRLLVDNQVTARGSVVEAAVKSTGPAKVVVLLLVDQAVTNVAFPDPQIDRSRIRMTMEKVDGRWLASKVELA